MQHMLFSIAIIPPRIPALLVNLRMRSKVVLENFVWRRKKSNENVQDRGDGKGFSFYLARHIFDDPYFTTTTATDPENEREVGIIPGDDQVMIVMDTEIERSKIRIISACHADNSSRWADLYWKNRKRREMFGSKKRKTETANEIVIRRKLIEEWRRSRKSTTPPQAVGVCCSRKVVALGV
jgi:uncharacterized DUF497 family protein